MGSTCRALVRYSSVQEASAVKDLFAMGGQMEGCDEPIVIDFANPSTGGAGGWQSNGGGDGCKGGGKGFATKQMLESQKQKEVELNMSTIVQGVLKLNVLPGSDLGNQDNCLYIAGLPPDCLESDLYTIFAPFGAIAPKG